MRKLFKKATSALLAFTILPQAAAIGIDKNIKNIKANAATSTQTYTIYGDLNGDKVIDSFDLVQMRRDIQNEQASTSSDLNRDEFVDEDDLIELQEYSLGANDFFEEYMNDDTDSDGLCDMIEISIVKSNPTVKDTDGDGLTDYDEVYLTLTSPTEKSTNGSDDSKADPDEDGIKNIDEIKNGTDPLLADTDEDGLSDYDEIYTHKTNPIEADTDGDGLNDYAELQLGFNPVLSKTNGTLDSEVKVEQTLSSDSKVFEAVNTDNNPYKMSIKINTNGYAEQELTVKESGYVQATENEAVIGLAAEIDSSEKCSPDSLTVEFKVDDKYLNCTLDEYKDIEELKGIKNLCIYKYVEKYSMLLPVETQYNNDIVYADVNEVGTYCLVDLSKWFSGIGVAPSEISSAINNSRSNSPHNSLFSDENSIEQEEFSLNASGNVSIEANKSAEPVDIVFLLPKNSSNFYNQLAWDFSFYIFNNANARVFIVQYSLEDNECRIFCPDENCLYSSSYSDIFNIGYPNVYKFTYDGTPFEEDLYTNLKLRDNIYIYKFGSNGTTLESQYEEYQFCKFFNCTYSVISNVSDLTLQSVIVNKDKPGVYINSSDIVDACDRLKEHFDSTFNGTGGSTGGTKGGPSGKTADEKYKYDVLIGNNYKTICLDAELSADSGVDTDGDGVSDWDEMNTLYCFSEIFDAGYTDILSVNASTAKVQMMSAIADRYVYVIGSDPTKKDSDGDGIEDKDDPDTLYKFDLKAFGQDEYVDEVNKKALLMYDTIIDLNSKSKGAGVDVFDVPKDKLYHSIVDLFPNGNEILMKCYSISDITSVKKIAIRYGQNEAVARIAIKIMMDNVNNCGMYTQFVSDENWLKFCEFFNSKVQKFGNVDQGLHYFRLKLNRTPDSFADLVADKSNWRIYPKETTGYHMNDGSFESTNPKYPDCNNLINNKYNMKFVDKYGMNEVVVTPNKDLSGMSNSQIEKYLEDESHWQILTDDYEKTQNNHNFKYDPINVGTYNYVAYDKTIKFVELDNVTVKKTKSKEHQAYDVKPYLGNEEGSSNWGNVPGLIYRNTRNDKDENLKKLNNTTSQIYNYWNENYF